MPRDSPKRAKKRLDRDRFGWVLTVSIIFHLVIVLGMSFVLPSQARNRNISPPLKITLVATQSESPNDDAETLAQHNSEGETDPSILPVLVESTPAEAASEEAEKRERLLLEEQARALYNPEKLGSEDKQNAVSDETRQQLTDSINLAFLNSQAKPRERFVSADAKSSEIAPYLENWRLLVERVGNLNYPDAAKQLEIEGDLVMDVTIHSDGSVAGVTILRSSGHKVLDDGAERILQIAAPFATFSEEMKREFDTLHIIRTWRFSQNKVKDVTQ